MLNRVLTTVGAVAMLGLSLPAFAAPMLVIPVQRIASPMTLEQVQKCVVNAATKHQWQIVRKDKNSVLLRYSRNAKWAADVKVTYSTKQYKIDYVDSYGLKYKEANGLGDIHRNYNRWVNNLNNTIQKNLSLL